ncbi:c-type cytochrome [Massilia glaciei]|uniref:Cytochrome c5 family protein n=1 Tax=Massilia glaciei TaxID=1524097 RepID=A0A2U2HIV7_9BURK|nr:c-type cytochrome [Massilia glaciei]PWF46727.1 cytochrome c5 family protein [Massilia glaciei]
MKNNTLLALLMAGALGACGQKAPAPEAAAADPAAVVVVAPVVAEPAAAPVVVAASAADLAIGEKVYGTSCVSCHGAAVLGAPKLGDKPSWTPRIAKGADALYKSAVEGIKMMPPRGGNAALKDEELKAAVDFMVSKAI